VVRPSHRCVIASCTSRSDSESSDAVASSKQDDLRVLDQGPRNRDALAFAA
jgi:hypothetical protein